MMLWDVLLPLFLRVCTWRRADPIPYCSENESRKRPSDIAINSRDIGMRHRHLLRQDRYTHAE